MERGFQGWDEALLKCKLPSRPQVEGAHACSTGVDMAIAKNGLQELTELKCMKSLHTGSLHTRVVRGRHIN